MYKETTHFTYDYRTELLHCSVCGMKIHDEHQIIPRKFCPNCGRKVIKVNIIEN